MKQGLKQELEKFKKIVDKTISFSEEYRISKYIARAGVCSRRQAEGLVESGDVIVNGNMMTEVSYKVQNQDKVSVKGKKIKLEETKLFILHKVKGTLTTNHDLKGRRTIFDLLPKDMPRVVTIGRLDYNTEGLLLLTNNGELAREMELPKNNFYRKYTCQFFGYLTKEIIAQLSKGVKIDGIQYRPIKVFRLSKSKEEQEGNKVGWCEIVLQEGKNREIRTVFEHFDIQVSRLTRTHYGPFSLGRIDRGGIMEVNIDKFVKA